MDGDDYFDCVLSSEYELCTIPAMKIFRICSGFTIPEAFDMINIVDRFKPMLLGQIQTKSFEEQEALKIILGKTSADIPIIIDYDDITISGKLNMKYLSEEYSTLEDYAEQDVYILCKVVGIVRKAWVEIFDPLKDFIRLPRAARRSMTVSENTNGLESIVIEGPVLKVEIIAIYK